MHGAHPSRSTHEVANARPCDSGLGGPKPRPIILVSCQSTNLTTDPKSFTHDLGINWSVTYLEVLQARNARGSRAITESHHRTQGKGTGKVQVQGARPTSSAGYSVLPYTAAFSRYGSIVDANVSASSKKTPEKMMYTTIFPFRATNTLPTGSPPAVMMPNEDCSPQW